MTIILHHLNASRSSRIIWLLEELKEAYGLSYEIVRHQRDDETNLAPPALAAVHPLGKAPLIVDGDVVVAESGAIAQYLVERYDTANRLHPEPHEADFAAYLEWTHAAEGSPFLPGLIQFYLQRAGLLDHPIAAYMAHERDKALTAVEGYLAENDWFAGARFTAADCLMGFMLDTAEASGALKERPAIRAYLARVRARPAHQWAMALI